MLDSDTKRRLDAARDTLVGKVPDPKSQVEQITIAMIYKFMDDMDAESEELGGKRKFFTKDFAKYGWSKILAPGLGGHEMLALYGEGITKMPQNPGVPELFRNIFKNAYLPYRDPETLKSFLKLINEFTYDHSERLGDAFEYLLSILGSQGDAGQFRTPRHIIDFMVEIMAPQKGEVILDPACGTSGFLISSYKHIRNNNLDKKGNTTLTPDDKAKLAKNFKGYDIDPNMVRLSLANMYLHGFTEPHIFEYDSLTSEERWNEFADVILANPPFMSPKGGIKPHKRFSIQAKRSEVLFVDYIAEHLTPKGRAAIIVPEGIIFQSQTAYKELRKMLVDNSLVAVISLPAGCFNPYSGVKTSILILDKSIAKTAKTIAFFKIENDGFGLGAQRRAIEKNDLPQVKAELGSYLQALKNKASIDSILPSDSTAQIVPKEKIIANTDYSLSSERYRDGVVHGNQRWPTITISNMCTLQRGLSYSTPEIGDEGNGIPFYNLKSIKRQGTPQGNDFKYFTGEVKDRHYVKPGDILIALTDLTPTSELIGSPKLITDSTKAAYSADLGKLIFKDETVYPKFLYQLLRSTVYRKYIVTYSHGANVKHLQSDGFYEFQIPLPPLEVQKEIVAEIEGSQKVIDGARAVIDNYRPHIPINPDWPMVELGEITKPEYGYTEKALEKGDARFIRITDISQDGKLRTEDPKFISLTEEAKGSLLSNGDILVARTGATFGKTMIFEEKYPAVFASFLIRLKFDKNQILSRYYWIFSQSELYWKQANSLMTGGGQPQFNGNALVQVKIPLPPLAIQEIIVAEIQAEQALVAANRKLITRFEKKIQDTLARIWGESV
jgi:type I restriction enzyme M protein